MRIDGLEGVVVAEGRREGELKIAAGHGADGREARCERGRARFVPNAEGVEARGLQAQALEGFDECRRVFGEHAQFVTDHAGAAIDIDAREGGEGRDVTRKHGRVAAEFANASGPIIHRRHDAGVAGHALNELPGPPDFNDMPVRADG
jgi:hypothetical protein